MRGIGVGDAHDKGSSIGGQMGRKVADGESGKMDGKAWFHC